MVSMSAAYKIPTDLIYKKEPNNQQLGRTSSLSIILMFLFLHVVFKGIVDPKMKFQPT